MTDDLDYRPPSYDPGSEVDVGPPENRAAAPGFGGGAWLPADDDAVEIARISLASTLGDDISVRAKVVADGIEYSVVDDSETTYVVAKPVRSAPLSTRELMELLDTVHDTDNDITRLTERWWEVIGPDWETRADLEGFVSVWSPFYPGLAEAYLARGAAWITRSRQGQ